MERFWRKFIEKIKCFVNKEKTTAEQLLVVIISKAVRIKKNIENALLFENVKVKNEDFSKQNSKYIRDF